MGWFSGRKGKDGPFTGRGGLGIAFCLTGTLGAGIDVPPVPGGQALLKGSDGSYLLGADGAYLYGRAA